MNKNEIRKKIVIGISCAFLGTVLIGFIGCKQVMAASPMNIQAHSQAEIRAFAKRHPAKLSSNTNYTIKPSIIKPYRSGKVSDKTEQESLNMLNQVRYIAGLSSDVSLNSTYEKQAQDAALIMALNKNLSHFPSKPSGLNDDIFQSGYVGAGNSNLASGGSAELVSSIVDIWMAEDNPFSLSACLHRAAILSPTMKQTGFGQVEDYMTMYAMDSMGTSSAYGIAWPAQNMPIEYWGRYYPFTFYTNHTEDINTIKVSLTRSSDGKTWNFSKLSSDGDFYAGGKAIIFRPKNGLEYKNGDQFTVSITGIKDPVSYKVNFFKIQEPVAVNSIHTRYGVRYKITSSSSKGGTASVDGITNKNAKDVFVEPTIEIDGYTYKVTAISSNALKNKKKLKSFTITKYVKVVGAKAFYGCKSLKKIEIRSKYLTKVGSKSLKGINKKATITVPKSKYKKYKKLLKNKGQKKSVKIKK